MWKCVKICIKIQRERYTKEMTKVLRILKINKWFFLSIKPHPFDFVNTCLLHIMYPTCEFSALDYLKAY